MATFTFTKKGIDFKIVHVKGDAFRVYASNLVRRPIEYWEESDQEISNTFSTYKDGVIRFGLYERLKIGNDSYISGVSIDDESLKAAIDDLVASSKKEIEELIREANELEAIRLKEEEAEMWEKRIPITKFSEKKQAYVQQCFNTPNDVLVADFAFEKERTAYKAAWKKQKELAEQGGWTEGELINGEKIGYVSVFVEVIYEEKQDGTVLCGYIARVLRRFVNPLNVMVYDNDVDGFVPLTNEKTKNSFQIEED